MNLRSITQWHKFIVLYIHYYQMYSEAITGVYNCVRRTKLKFFLYPGFGNVPPFLLFLYIFCIFNVSNVAICLARRWRCVFFGFLRLSKFL
jgi:hypothetical protein